MGPGRGDWINCAMHASLARLLHEVIDYAGLFPPCKLPMRDSVENYVRYREGSETWILSRFICPASRLMELEQELARGENPDCISLSVVGTGGNDIEEFETNLEKDVADMNRFEDAVGDRCEIEGFEIRAPGSADIDKVVHDLEGFGDVDVFVELPWAADMHDGIVALAESEWLGLKARTGGIEPSAFPSTQQLAAFLRDCLNLDVPFKLTAGLHHPVRRRDENMGVMMHGYINVLAAAALAESHDLNTAEIEKVLEDTKAENFVFGETGFGWHDYGASIEDIDSIRGLFVSFGSCSVEEPIEDLKRVGLMAVKA